MGLVEWEKRNSSPPPQGTLNGRGSLSNPGWAWYGKVAEMFDEANWIYFWCKRI